ncbi:MAG TPA: protein DpdJ [Pseudonocardiaceae bacterium]
MTLSPDVASALLTALEDRELPLLSWGVTGGALTEDEVRATLTAALAQRTDAPGVTPAEAQRHLLEHALLLREPASSPPRFRTRMAEALRLAARLRQLFWWQRGRMDSPAPPSWWEQGRRLVADYRMHVAPRWYPRRDQPLAAIRTALADVPGWGPLQSELAEAYIGERELARFQIEAARAVLTSVTDRLGRGVIVGAGTGTGKTLSFYLPAFSAMAENLRSARSTRVHTMAIYPRKELLRDQLREAVSVARTLAPVLRAAKRRPVRIGVLYGATPDSRAKAGRSVDKGGWQRHGNDLVCPYLPCPGADEKGCQGELMWRAAERGERLRCRSCGLVLDDLALTRSSLIEQPPDLLFTTTEMLNRNATAPLGQIMGWGGGRAPDLVLLDEVHTYSEMHGAQVALLLRRWRDAVRVPVTFVGLSATLRSADTFFAQLTGLDVAAVDHVTPVRSDMQAEGREYALALRGDPVSGASLLSTSIQTAMLFGRILDPPQHEYLHGSTGFLFTDDLDVTNRFYDDLRDAEGQQDRRGRSSGKPGRVLAALRSPDADHTSERYLDGQSWDVVQRIGRTLPPQADAGELRIGRTTSQDAGVDLEADLIVATASLEVGFDDPRVGLVLQHKAPYDSGGFLQRRGRAGRQRGTRPWTVVALSDYGRDRLTYQAYDQLFSPELVPRSLPIGNRNVLRIQGTQALLDWMGAMLGDRGRSIDPREVLAPPRKRSEPDENALIGLLEALLGRSDLQDSLHRHLRRALQISTDEATALLWEQPRSLLLAVVPTALRRLRVRGSDLRGPAVADPGAGALLPEFLTRSMFEPLNLPEVTLAMPFDPDRTEGMPIERALREAVPGRVSMRFGYRHSEHRTWLAEPPTNGLALELTTLDADFSRQGRWHTDDGTEVEVLRPLRLGLQQPEPEIETQSQGIPTWMSALVNPAAGLAAADVPNPSPWYGRIRSAGFATHAGGNPATIRRMTVGADCETVRRGGKRERRSVSYQFDGQPAAMGFELSADAVRFDVNRLDATAAAVTAHLTSPAWRSLAFRTAVAEDPALAEVATTFQRGWLAQVYLTSFALSGLDGRSGQQTQDALAGGAWRSHLGDVLRALYRDSGDGPAANQDRLVTGLTALSDNHDVTARLDEHATLLWATDVAARTAGLAQRVYDETLAAAIRVAALRACPDARDHDLLIDVVPRRGPDQPTLVWLGETAIGGTGVVEQLVRFYAADPRRYWGLVDSALQPGTYEYVDIRLRRLLEHVAAEPVGAVAAAMDALRTAGTNEVAIAALDDLRAAWAALDGNPPHAVVAALATRMLRPGSNAGTDRAALEIVQAWDQTENQLGVELDAQVIAYLVGSGRLTVPGVALSTDQVFSLLWPRGLGAEVRHLQHYQPYGRPPLLDRRLVEAAHDLHVAEIDVTAADWTERFRAEMVRNGTVDLVAPAEQRAELAAAVRSVPLLAVDRDVLRVYGEARRVVQDGALLRVRIEIREVLQ